MPRNDINMALGTYNGAAFIPVSGLPLVDTAFRYARFQGNKENTLVSFNFSVGGGAAELWFRSF